MNEIPSDSYDSLWPGNYAMFYDISTGYGSIVSAKVTVTIAHRNF